MVPTIMAAAIPIRKVFPEVFILNLNDTRLSARGQPGRLILHKPATGRLFLILHVGRRLRWLAKQQMRHKLVR